MLKVFPDFQCLNKLMPPNVECFIEEQLLKKQKLLNFALGLGNSFPLSTQDYPVITMKKSTRLLIITHLTAVVTVICWGSSFLATKVLMETGGLKPVEMYTYRFIAAYLILLAITFRHILSNNWRDELTFLLCGACAGSLYFITENYALQNTTAGNVSLLASVSPLFTAFLLAVFFRTKVKVSVIIGSIVALVGVGFIICSHGEGFVIKPKGDLLALCASLSWAVYTIAVKRLIPLYSTLFITRKLFFYGVLTSLPLLFNVVPMDQIGSHIALLFDFSKPMFFSNFAFLVVMCSVLAYILWNEVMKKLGPVASNNYLYGQPLVTMFAGALLLGEHITLFGYIGCVMVIGGLILSDKLNFKYERLKIFRRK